MKDDKTATVDEAMETVLALKGLEVRDKRCKARIRASFAVLLGVFITLHPPPHKKKF